MFDIHCHILYGLDDGSSGVEESLKMIDIARSGRTQGIIATPHCNVPGSYRNHWGEDLENRLKAIQKRLSENSDPFEVYPGQEIFCDGNFLEMLKNGELITLNHSRYPLVEFDFTERSSSVYEKLESVLAEGYTPVVAHPERYAFVQESPDAIFHMKRMGCLLQINKGSLKGAFGQGAFAASHFLVAHRLADVMASDGHSPYVRTPYMADAYEIICENYSYDYAELIAGINPQRIIEDKSIR